MENLVNWLCLSNIDNTILYNVKPIHLPDILAKIYSIFFGYSQALIMLIFRI